MGPCPLSSSTLSFEQLPDEIHMMVFSYADLSVIERVSKRSAALVETMHQTIANTFAPLLPETTKGLSNKQKCIYLCKQWRAEMQQLGIVPNDLFKASDLTSMVFYRQILAPLLPSLQNFCKQVAMKQIKQRLEPPAVDTSQTIEEQYLTLFNWSKVLENKTSLNLYKTGLTSIPLSFLPHCQNLTTLTLVANSKSKSLSPTLALLPKLTQLAVHIRSEECALPPEITNNKRIIVTWRRPPQTCNRS